MNKVRLATIWLDGCSGCHMSFLDMDERLMELAGRVDVVFSPYVDTKTFPENVDLTLVEGAAGTEEDCEKLRLIRQNTKILISLGDCAVTGNVSSMRNPFDVAQMMQHVYHENVTLNPQTPQEGVPHLLARACPVHEVVDVDIFVPGCPPAADVIYYTLTELLEGRTPDLSSQTRFGA
jgi:NAD-reducing hydrogenase small subunit